MLSPTFKKLPLAPSLILLVAFLAWVFEAVTVDYGVYHRALITQGEYWRIFTGHFFHTNSYHLLLNALAVILLWALHGKYFSNHASNNLLQNSLFHYLSLMIFCALGVSCGMYFFTPETTQYVGLSGILHGVFFWGVFHDIKAKDKTVWLLLLGGVGKLIYEQIWASSTVVNKLIAAPVAYDAHLYGALSGFIFALASYLLMQAQRKS